MKFGYIVTGVTAATYRSREDSYQRRVKQREEAKAAGKRMPRALKPTNLAVMRRVTIYGPTQIKAAADDALALAIKTGYVECRVEEIRPAAA